MSFFILFDIVVHEWRIGNRWEERGNNKFNIIKPCSLIGGCSTEAAADDDNNDDDDDERIRRLIFDKRKSKTIFV